MYKAWIPFYKDDDNGTTKLCEYGFCDDQGPTDLGTDGEVRPAKRLHGYAESEWHWNTVFNDHLRVERRYGRNGIKLFSQINNIMYTCTVDTLIAWVVAGRLAGNCISGNFVIVKTGTRYHLVDT